MICPFQPVHCAHVHRAQIHTAQHVNMSAQTELGIQGVTRLISRGPSWVAGPPEGESRQEFLGPSFHPEFGAKKWPVGSDFLLGEKCPPPAINPSPTNAC